MNNRRKRIKETMEDINENFMYYKSERLTVVTIEIVGSSVFCIWRFLFAQENPRVSLIFT